MKERGIIFSTAMVRALLAGAKTQTRRLLKVAPRTAAIMARRPDARWYWHGGEGTTTHGYGGLCVDENGGTTSIPARCPFGGVGDRLWVRETHAQFTVGNRTGDAPLCVAYRATCDDDGSFTYVNNGDEIMSLRITKWTPAIHMPRWASRITLEVTGVRVERLQDISASDAVAEGVVDDAHGWDGNPAYPLARFRTLWDQINGERADWKSNPWVWVVAFRRVDDQRATEAA